MFKMERINNFDQLFYKREFAKIKGTKAYNLIILTLILFVSYFALSFLQNYKDKLQVQMENPYTNWISVDIPNHKVDEANYIIENFKDKELRNSFNLDTVNYYNIQHIEGINEINGETLGKLRVRSIDSQSKLLSRILDENNIYIDKEELQSECWAIINKSVYGADKRKKDNLFVSVIRNQFFALPLLGIVDQLPDNCDVLVSDHMMSILQMRCAAEQFREQTKTNNVKVMLRDTANVDVFISDFESYSGRLVVYTDIKQKYINRFKYQWVTLSLDDFYESQLFNQYLNEKGLLAISDLECNAHRPCQIEDPYYLTLNFNSLDKVSSLRDHLASNYGFKISLHDVKAKENFATVANMAMSTSIIIILLSISFVILFLHHILESHISSIKSSIGTLKAFGLSNEKIVRSYSVICGKLFLQASAIALILLVFIQFVSSRIAIKIMTIDSMPILLTWLISFFAIFIFCTKIIEKIFSKTPGDLIYNR